MQTNHLKKSLILLALCFSTIAMSSCFRLPHRVRPSENLVTKEFEVEGFNGITASKRMVLHYSVSDEYSVRAEGPENMMDKLRCEVSQDNVLNLEVYKGEKFSISNDSEKIHVLVTAPMINRFSARGDVKIKCDTLAYVNNLSIETFNASQFVCDSLSAEGISISSYNAARVVISSCQADMVNASAFNAGSIKMTAKVGNMLSLEAHNGAKISFTGTATTLNAQAFNGALIQLEGEFQTKRISKYNGARIKIKD